MNTEQGYGRKGKACSGVEDITAASGYTGEREEEE